jgi:ELWxxDGT repeat protein
VRAPTAPLRLALAAIPLLLFGTPDRANSGRCVVRDHPSTLLQAQREGAPLAVAGRQVFFVEDRAGLYVLWASDGTVAGTRQLAQFAERRLVAQPTAALGDILLFQVRTVSPGTNYDPTELWRSDGTADGTTKIANLPGGPGDYGPGPNLVKAGHRVVLVVAQLVADNKLLELWSTDGTSAGTGKIADIPGHFEAIEFGDRTLLYINDGSLWITDGTTAGTQRAPAGSPYPPPYQIVARNDDALFYVPEASREHWSLFRLRVGARGPDRLVRHPLVDAPNGPKKVSLAGRLVDGGKIFYTGYGADRRWSLWSVGGRHRHRLGTTSTPWTLEPCPPFGACWRPPSGLDLRATVGGRLLFVDDGTVKVTNAKGLHARAAALPAAPGYADVDVGASILFHTPYDSPSGPPVLWLTDGTPLEP